MEPKCGLADIETSFDTEESGDSWGRRLNEDLAAGNEEAKLEKG